MICTGAAKVLEGLERKETSPAMSKPMNRVRTELTPQQRIAVYEYVLQVKLLTTIFISLSSFCSESSPKNVSNLFHTQCKKSNYIHVRRNGVKNLVG